jgi:hypothetical protein
VTAPKQQTGRAARDRVRQAIVLGILGAIAAAAVGGLGGCYRRVIGAKGIGADQYEISEPYQKDTRVDRWFYGSESRRGGSKLP